MFVRIKQICREFDLRKRLGKMEANFGVGNIKFEKNIDQSNVILDKFFIK